MTKRGSFPHPIIDMSDDVSSDFDVRNVLVAPTQQDIEITYDVLSDDPELLNLLDSGKAMHSLRWSCSSTISTGELEPVAYQRTNTGMRLRAWLDQDNVKGNVDLEVRVIAISVIDEHSWSKQHDDYDTATFQLQPGDLLADGGTIRFSANKLYDPLDPPVGSFFRFISKPNQRKHIVVSFSNNETVDVQLPEKTFESFKLFSNRPDFQISLVVLPALIETLIFIEESKENEPLGDKAWYRAIEKLVDERGGWDQSKLELAQKILESPIDTAIRTGLSTEEDF